MDDPQSSPSPEAWYQAEDALLGALRRGTGPKRPPLEIPGFDETRELFCGGQGRVYAAVRRATGLRVAIKVLREDRFDEAAGRRRFEREIEIISALQHPHLVPIIGHGCTTDDRPYLVMPFIEGAPLDEHLLGPGRDDAERLDVRDALRVILGACDAVHYAHQHGVIHRDLKPSNIRVDRDGEAHVLDFGIAVEVDADARRIDASRVVTSTGAFLGSLAWASPEQVDAAPGGIDIRSDVYSLGVVLYQMLTGRLPHDTGGSLREALRRITESPPPPPGRLRAMDDDVETIVQRCLAKRPERRYQSAGDLATDIRRYLAGEPIEARRDNAWERAQITLRRYRYAAIAGAVVLLVLIGATAAMTVLYGQAERARAVAQQQRVQTHRQANAARAAMSFLKEIFSESDPVIGGADATLRSVIEHAAERYDQVLRDQPGAMAQVAYILGRASFHQGYLDDAARLAEHAIAIEEQRLDENDDGADRIAIGRSLAESLELLGLVRHGQYRLEEAEDLFARAIEIRPDGQRGRSAAMAMIDLGNVYAAQGRLDLADSIWTRAAATAPAADRAIALLYLGRLRSIQGRLPEAEALLVEALPLIERHHGERNVYVALTHYELARIQLLRVDADAAIVHIELAQAIFAEHHDADYVRRIDCTLLRAEALYRQQRIDDAMVEFERAIAAYRGSVSAAPEDVARGLERMGSVLAQLGRHADAEPLLREAVEVYAARRGETDPNLALTRSRLGCTLAALGQLEAARALLLQARPVLEATYGSDDLRVDELRECLERLQ